MKISCPNCPAAYELDDNRVPPAGLSIKCPKCKTPFIVHRPKPGETAAKGVAVAPKPGASDAVPLPGQQGGASQRPPAPAGAAQLAGPRKPDAQGPAVPLPGQASGQASAAPPALPDLGGALPLPGLDGDFELPPPPAPSRPPSPVASRPPAAPPRPAAPATSRPPASALGLDAIPLPGLDDALAPPPSAPAPRAAAPVAAQEEDDPFAGIDVEQGGDASVDEKPVAPPPPDLDLAFPPEPEPQREQDEPPSGSDDPFAIDLPEPTAPRAAARPPPPPAPSMPPPAVMPDDGGISFDFVEAPQSSREPEPPPSPAINAGPPPGSPELLDFVDEQPAARPAPRAGRAPPPMLSKSEPSSPAPSASTDLSSLEISNEGDAPAAEDKKARKEREKLEKEERKDGERRERLEKREAARAARAEQDSPGAKAGHLAQQAAAFAREPRHAALIAAGLAAVLFVGLGLHARRTPAGLFWMNKFIPAKKAASAAEVKVLQKGQDKLAEGSFAGAREALAMAAQLLAATPDDEEAKSFFVLCSSELKLGYGQTGGDWDQAKTLVDKIKGTGPSETRARGAFALANGDVPKARGLLQPLGDLPGADVESVYLFAQSLVLSGEAAHAAQVLDNALKGKAGADSPKLLIARGVVAQRKGQLPEAAAFLEKASQKAPDNGKALVEWAEVKLRQGDAVKSQELVDRALSADVRKSLDATEEARASMLKGKLLAAEHKSKDAEASFDRAVALDPTSADVRAAYGEFRLGRREYEKAAKQFDGVQAATDAQILGGAARAYLGTNRLLEADKKIVEAVAKDPSDPRLLYVQGRVAEAIGKGEEAMKSYERALAKKPDLADALVAEAQVYISRGELPKAKEKLEAALKTPEASKTPKEDEAVGDLCLQLNEPQKAKEQYTTALSRDPEDPFAHAGLGRALAALDELPAARRELEAALAQVDTDASLHYAYGSLLRRVGESDNALIALQRAVKLDSKDPRFRSRLGALLVERKEYDKAEDQLRQATLMNDKYAEGLFFLARALAGQNKLSEAIDVMKKAVETEPDNADYLFWLGLIYEQGQQVQDAVDAFTRSIAKKKNADAYEHLGQDLVTENRFADAVEAFKKGADLDPKRARLWAEVGDAQQQAGDVDGAIANFTKALNQDATMGDAWGKLGIAYKDKGCAECKRRAFEALKRSVQIDPRNATAHHELGYMYKDDGRRGEAIAEFKKYLDLKPDAGDVETVQDDIYYLKEESHRAP